MTISQLKTQVKTILRENMMNEETYKLGSVEYTKKNMTPVDILGLAMAYSQASGNKMYGGKMEKMIKVGNDLAKLNGTTQLDVKKRGSKPALILTLLKNKLVTKDEYIKLYKDLLAKQISVVKSLNNADPASRMVGGAAARAAHRDMKGEFGESVNESLEFVVNTYRDGKSYIGYYDSRSNQLDRPKFIPKPYGNTKDAIKVAKKLAKSNKGKYIDDFMVLTSHPDIYGKPGDIKESVNESTEPEIISQLRDVVKNGYKTLKDPKTGKKMKVDSYSASAITQVYDAIKNPSTQDKFVKSGLLGMQSVSFKAIRK